jgi:hypothetical protein
LHAAARDEVRATCELDGAALALEAPRRRRLGRDAHELDRLLVAAAVAARRETDPSELGREIRLGELVAFGSRQAAAVTVVRELGHDAADILAVDGLSSGPGRCRDQRCRARRRRR